MTLEGILGEAVSRLGIQGVSTVALVALGSIVIWSSRARRVGYVAGRGIATARWVAVSLLALTIAGVVTVHPERAAALAGRAPEAFDWLQGAVS
jgi:hypothetical protein